MNVGAKVVTVIASVMSVDRSDVDSRTKIEEDLDMDDSDMEVVLEKLERILKADLIDFYDSSEVRTVGQLVRFIKEQMEM
jgi:acyl carrier protein